MRSTTDSFSSAAIPRLVIAGVSSGVGKTTVMLALARALRDRGLKVVCFKCGPDYLDPTYHQQNLQEPCHNLDGWMMGKEAVQRTFARATQGADIALMEGVMGLFDGADVRGEAGSTAEIAKWLAAPVVLVADAGGMARTIDAIAHGFKTYDPDLSLAGLICNRVGSAGHLQLLKQACRSLEVLGGLPRKEALQFPERHLGLVSALKSGQDDPLFEAWAQLAREHFDLDALLAKARSAPLLDLPRSDLRTHTPVCRLAYAWDEAFHFYYDDNLGLLEAAGARLIPFSPLHDHDLPPCDGIYIGGGYPELYADQLSRNQPMKDALTRAAAAQRPIYAECGGYMYLSEAILNRDGQRYPMVGLIPGTLTMHDKLQSLGYVEVEVQSDSLLGEAGLRYRGHEFRYSTYAGDQAPKQSVCKLRKRRNQEVRQEGYQVGSVLGTYVHAHWASNPKIAQNIVQACVQRKVEDERT